MLKNLWPAVPLEHVPIQPITNGIHIPSWISFEMNDLFERYLGSKWREKQDYRDAWEKVQNIPDPELWNVHEIRRRRLIAFTRQRLQKQLIAKGASNLLISESQEALNPVALTIGFARRFATYKRAYLIFKDKERLLRILNNPERPVQLVFAGKAHPQDQAGKELIKDIISFMSGRTPAQEDRLHRGLRHQRGPLPGLRRRYLAEHAAAASGGLRHLGHEGRLQRRAEFQRPGRLVGRSLRPEERLGHRQPRSPIPTRNTRTRSRARPFIPSWRRTSSPCSTSAARTACRANGSA